MTKKLSGYENKHGKEEIFIERARGKIPVNKNGSICQSDFKIGYNGFEYGITILANQPIYASDDGRKFELIPEGMKETMPYAELNIEGIIFHSGKDDEIKKKIESMLEALK